MKAIKIIIAVVVLLAIGVLVWYMIGDTPGIVDDGPNDENVAYQKIQKEIDSLGNMPDSMFCNDLHKAILYDIKINEESGDLSANLAGNLRTQLYSAYSEKLKDQVDYNFKETDWSANPDAIRFMKAELSALKDTTYLKDANARKEIDVRLGYINRYYELFSFADKCYKFEYKDYDLSARFPNVVGKIDTSRNYLNGYMKEYPLNKCITLRRKMENVPDMLLKNHASYICKKIDNMINDKIYEQYDKRGFVSQVGEPLQDEINDMVNIYEDYVSSSTLESEKQRALKKLAELKNLNANNY